MGEMGPISEAMTGVAERPGPVGLAPRVTIGGFCDTPDMLEAVRLALKDRRLARTHGALHEGGLEAAIEYCATAATPNVMIIETRHGRDRLVGDLERLAELCDAGTKLIVLGHVNDVALYRDLVRQGISEYIVAPVQPTQIIEAVLALFSDAHGGALGRVIAFMGAKGGVGSSTIAHNVAWTISEMLDEDVIIADFDLAFGTGGLNFNVDPSQGMADALNAPERIDGVLIDRLLTKCTEHLSLLAAPAQVDRDYRVDQESVDLILNALRTNVPCVIADVPNEWQDWTRHILQNSDEVVITATPDLACLRNTKSLLDRLRTVRPNDHPPRVVLNQTGVPKRTEISAAEFMKVCGLEALTVIGYDGPLFMNAANNGQMLSQINAGSKAVATLRELASTLSGRKMPVKRSSFSLKQFGQSLLGRKG